MSLLNPFSLKKWASLIIAAFIPTVFYNVGMIYYGSLWIALACFAGGLFVAIMLGWWLLKNPFQALLEGKGILCLDISSSGIIRPFIANVNQPYIKARLQGEDVIDVFDREIVSQIANPEQKGEVVFITSDREGKPLNKKGLYIMLTEDQYNRGRFALYHYPVLIFNSQLKTFMTKDVLSEIEKNVFSEHLVLYLNRKIEELTSLIRDFGRYVVELTKPKESLFKNKWLWIIIVIGVVILGAIFLPYIISAVKGGISTVQAETGGAAVSVR